MFAMETNSSMQFESSYETSSILQLPPETLSYIFKNLNVTDKKVASQVCQTWKGVACIPGLWKGVTVDLDQKSLSLVRKLNKQGIRRFRLIDRNANHNMLLCLLKEVPNLEGLTIQFKYHNYLDGNVNFPIAFAHKLPKLMELYIDVSSSNLDDHCLELICRNCPNLKSLHISNCCGLTDKSLLFEAGNLKQLRNIYLGDCEMISDTGLKNLASASNLCEPPTLRNGYLGKPLKMSNPLGLVQSQNHQAVAKNKLHLDLGCEVTDAGLACLVNIAHWHIVCLNLSLCPMVTDDGLKYIAEMRSLRELQIMVDGQTISEIGFGYLVERKSGIENLIITGGIFFGDCVLEQISLLPYLKFLGRGVCLWWGCITEAGIRHLSRNAHLIENIEMFRCSALNGNSMASLARITTLNKLNLVECNITDESLGMLVEHGSQIKHIGLRRCPSMTDSGLEQLAKIPTLRSLDLRGNRRITSVGIKNVAKANAQLTITTHH